MEALVVEPKDVINHLNEEIKELKSEVGELKEEVTDLKDEVTTLRGGIFKLQESVNNNSKENMNFDNRNIQTSPELNKSLPPIDEENTTQRNGASNNDKSESVTQSNEPQSPENFPGPSTPEVNHSVPPNNNNGLMDSNMFSQDYFAQIDPVAQNALAMNVQYLQQMAQAGIPLYTTGLLNPMNNIGVPIVNPIMANNPQQYPMNPPNQISPISSSNPPIPRLRRTSQIYEHFGKFNSPRVNNPLASNMIPPEISHNFCRDRRRMSVETSLQFGVSFAQKGSSMEDKFKTIGFNRGRRDSVVSLRNIEALIPPTSSTPESPKEEDGNVAKKRKIDDNTINNASNECIPPVSVPIKPLEESASRNTAAVSAQAASNYAFFAVYDGHGGTQASDFLRQFLHGNIVNHKEFKTDIEKAIKEGFIETEQQFINQVCKDNRAIHGVGSTAVIAVIETTNSAVTLYIAHVGDSEAVLSRKGEAVPITEPHNLKNPKERARVEAVGGKIYKERLAHPVWNPAVLSIAVTRAIGDLYFKLDEYTEGKPSGLISEPQITKIALTTNDEFLLLASDGFWDVVPKQAAVDFVKRQPKDMDVNQICKGLTDYALKEKTLDDTTVLVVKWSACNPRT